MERIGSVDTVRLAAILGVICIHVMPFEDPAAAIGTTLDLATVANQLARFAVPFFFVVSGFFWAGRQAEAPSDLRAALAPARRIVFLFVAWSLIYLLPLDVIGALERGPEGPLKVAYWDVTNAATHPICTVLEGTQIHLWFLSSLACAMVITALCLRFAGWVPLVVLAVLLYLLGLAGKAYADSPLGFHSSFNFRDGPFFGLLFFVAGALLRRRGARPEWLPAGLLLLVAGLVVQFAELTYLHEAYGTSMKQDFVLGTAATGIGAGLIALSGTRHLDLGLSPAAGARVLGVYCCHVAIIELLRPLAGIGAGSVAAGLVQLAVVFSLSWLMAGALAAHPRTRRLVS